MDLILLALAPVLIIAVYIYFRDKYEKEPIRMLLESLLVGGLISIPVLVIENNLMVYKPFFPGILGTGFDAFIVAAGTEEAFKFVGLFYLIWKNKNFNEKFDGIVYAVFVSLGFAAVENVMYVLKGGVSVGLMRSFTAVPAHALFGIVMGYYFGLAKFFPKKRLRMMRMSLFMAILMHGIYDFILMSGHNFLMFLFLPFLVFLLMNGMKKMKELSVIV